MEQKDFDQACRFLKVLVAVVQRHGVSSSAMESLLVRVLTHCAFGVSS